MENNVINFPDVTLFYSKGVYAIIEITEFMNYDIKDIPKNKRNTIVKTAIKDWMEKYL